MEDLRDEIIDLNLQLEYCSNEREQMIAQIMAMLKDDENLQNQYARDQSHINELQTENRNPNPNPGYDDENDDEENRDDDTLPDPEDVPEDVHEHVPNPNPNLHPNIAAKHRFKQIPFNDISKRWILYLDVKDARQHRNNQRYLHDYKRTGGLENGDFWIWIQYLLEPIPLENLFQTIQGLHNNEHTPKFMLKDFRCRVRTLQGKLELYYDIKVHTLMVRSYSQVLFGQDLTPDCSLHHYKVNHDTTMFLCPDMSPSKSSSSSSSSSQSVRVNPFR